MMIMMMMMMTMMMTMMMYWIDLTQDGSPQLQDLGMTCLPILPGSGVDDNDNDDGNGNGNRNGNKKENGNGNGNCNGNGKSLVTLTHRAVVARSTSALQLWLQSPLNSANILYK